ncbi:MAG: alpha-xylosidase [Chloroflexi bacterium OHK40]
MKFTDGAWLIRPGVQASHPVAAVDIAADHNTLTVYAATRPIRQRGETLQGPLLTVHLSAPAPDVIRVRLINHAGAAERGPHFAIEEAPTAVAISTGPGFASLSSGRLTARIALGDRWRMEFLGEGRTLTASGTKAMGSIDLAGVGHFMHEQLGLGVGELVYGLGERFTAFAKNGQVVEIWNKDGGTGSEQAYKNVPFYLTNRGYGVFVNHPGAVSFEVGSEKVSRVQFSVPGQTLEYFLIYGPTPKAVLEKYTALTGRPALPPAWSFGLWLTTSFTTAYDEATVTGFIEGMAQRDIPLHVFHFDCFWMRAFHWCDFIWDPATFPDPAGMLARLKARGLHISLWINPYIAQRSHLFAEGAAKGFLLRRPDGSVWQTELWQPGMAIVDFTNPEARAWFQDQLRPLLAMGVDCFKTDFGERIPTDVIYHDGSDPERMHNAYALYYNQVVFELLEATRGPGEAVVFARSATAGGQRFPVHWGGDCDSTFESMAESLRGGLSLGLSGFGFWSHDIGGFEGTPPAELYKRWIAFGLLSSHSRLHGSSSYRVPWLVDDESVDVLRHFTRLKCRLMPYLYGAAVEASRTGVPVLRAMLLEFPDDPGAEQLDRQYMLGDKLLVAPVFNADGLVSYYVPAGRWTHLLSGAVVEGPRWLREKHDVFSLPLLVRPNSVIALGANATRPDYAYADGVTLAAYELSDDVQIRVVVPDTAGAESAIFVVRRAGTLVCVDVERATGPWQLLLVNQSVTEVRGGSATARPEGLLITPEPGVARVEARLTVG